MEQLNPGDRLGLYEIVSRLGQGGMGFVYRAKQGNGIDVALKVRFPDSSKDSVDALRWEAEIGSLIGRHPNIVGIENKVEEDRGYIFLAMDYIEGESLYDVIEDEGKINPVLALKITRDIADALMHMHRKNIVHRDVKAGNIMVKGENALLLDLGLAYDMNRKFPLKKEGIIFGTVGFVAPEYAYGRDPHPRGDIYALGVTLLHMLIGERVLDDDPLFGDVFKIRDYSRIIPYLGLPVLLENLCMKSLEKRPVDRFQTASDFIASIDWVLSKI